MSYQILWCAWCAQTCFRPDVVIRVRMDNEPVDGLDQPVQGWPALAALSKIAQSASVAHYSVSAADAYHPDDIVGSWGLGVLAVTRVNGTAVCGWHAYTMLRDRGGTK